MFKIVVRGVFLMVAAVLLTSFQPTPALAKSDSDSAKQSLRITGQGWKATSENEKLAFLYGATGVIAIEHIIADEENRKPSVFAIGWENALGDKSLRQLMNEIDAWYAKNPGQEQRNLFDVLWYEFIQPRS